MPHTDTPPLSDIAAESDTYDPDLDEGDPPGSDTRNDGDVAYWRGILFPLDTPSGDGMVYASTDQLKVRPLPLPFKYQRSDAPEHQGAVVVGHITNVWTADVDDPNAGQIRAVMGEGQLDPHEEAAMEVRRKLDDGYAGWVSVETDATTGEVVEAVDGTSTMVATDYRVMAATLVGQAAFAEARVALVNNLLGDSVHQPDTAEEAADGEGGAGLPGDEDEDEEDPPEGRGGFTAAVVGDTDLPWAPRDREWDGGAARQAVAAWASSDGSGDKDTIDWSRYGRAFLYRDDSDNSGTEDRDFGDFKYPFATVIDGELTAVYRALGSAASYLARPNNGIPQNDLPRVRGRLGQLYQRARDAFDDDSIRPPWEETSGRSAATPVQQPDAAIPACALLAAGGPTAPPSDWFADPQLSEPTPLTVGDDGRVWGHLAAWDSCHTGYPGRCQTPPVSRSGYSYFHTGAIRTRDDHELPVGTLVIGTDHPSDAYSASGAMSYYANTGAAVAAVRAGEDAHGIWVAGAVLPGVDEQQVATLRRAPLSGDWRVIGGRYELVAALAVNTPGFPIPRARVASAVDGAPWSMVAAGVVQRSRAEPATCACGREPNSPGPVDEDDGKVEKLAATIAAELARIANTNSPAGGEVEANAASNDDEGDEPEGQVDTADVVTTPTQPLRMRRARTRLARSRLHQARR